MPEARFGRELMLRCGPMVIVAAAARIFLRVEPWIWLMPLAVGAVVVAGGALRLREEEGMTGDASRGRGPTAEQ